jgi:peptidoglycan/LPS O-acetylase OafA/YrhL
VGSSPFAYINLLAMLPLVTTFCNGAGGPSVTYIAVGATSARADSRVPHAKERNWGIDALRGFSVLVVMMLHGAAPAPAFVLRSPLLSQVVANGFFGVSIFFVISGFLIASNTLTRYGELSAISISQFYVMRVGRIFPCVALFVLVYHFLMLARIDGFVPERPQLFYSSVMSLVSLQFNYAYLTFLNVPGLYPFAPLWSLSIEECFYLMFPLICFFLRRMQMIVFLLVAVAIYSPIYRSSFASTILFRGSADLLCIGCLTAIMVNRVGLTKIPLWLAHALVAAGMIIVLVVFAYFPCRDFYKWTLTVLGLGVALILVGTSRQGTARGLLSLLLTPLSFLGRMSLQLYVFHAMLIELFKNHLSTPVAFAATILLAHLLDRLVLGPANSWIRVFYSPKGAQKAELAIALP